MPEQTSQFFVMPNGAIWFMFDGSAWCARITKDGEELSARRTPYEQMPFVWVNRQDNDAGTDK